MAGASDSLCEAIYAGILGKAIGVRLGAPVEPTIWTYERIKGCYGDIHGYLRDFKNFAADDDTNGPYYFIRALRDYGDHPTPEDIGRTWLNYAAEGHGMFWWGGFGRSTENTAYCNLKAGIPAPRSGSIAQNGAAIAEQIGGQIFIDSWGWVCPGDPARAARMAATAASVSHDGEGLNGARFVGAMIAAAFTAKSVDTLFAAGLGQIPSGSAYARVVKAVLTFHRAHPGDWRACRAMLEREFGYDRYPGVCHIIPNSGAMALAIAYGRGDLPRTVEIATMCGWDTDCNAGNAGSIIGTFSRVKPDWDRYRMPINDTLIASGVTGTLNIIDIPSFARELSVLALRLKGAHAPALWRQDMERRGVRFDFALAGATHGFRAGGNNCVSVKWGDSQTCAAGGALEILVDRLARGHSGRVFWKPFYRRADFDDERYAPMLSPIVASRQTVAFRLYLDPWESDGDLRFVPYVRLTMSGAIEELGGWRTPQAGAWREVRFVVPDLGGDAIDEIGIIIEYFGRKKFLGRLYLGDFMVSGAGHTRIDPAKLVEEWGGISRFTWNRGYWTLEDGRIAGLAATDADLWTGHAYATDVQMRAEITPLAGDSHLVVVRAQGAGRFYAAGFKGDKVVIEHEDFATTTLTEAAFNRELGRPYTLELEARGDQLRLLIDGKELLHATHDQYRYGMCGLRLGSAGRMRAGIIEIDEFSLLGSSGTVV